MRFLLVLFLLALLVGCSTAPRKWNQKAEVERARSTAERVMMHSETYAGGLRMSYCYDPAVAARKARNVDVYEETMKICRMGGYETPNIRPAAQW